MPQLLTTLSVHSHALWTIERGASPVVATAIHNGHAVRKELEAPFGAAVELSWRLSSKWQGKGLASEAAEASVHFGLVMPKLKD